MGRWEQLRLSLLLLSAMCITSAVIAALASATPVIQDQTAREVALHRSSNGYYLYNGGYVDNGDYVLIGQLPNDDYSRGGVYFIGASEMNTAIMTWTLPPAERRLIHNYALGDLRHIEARHYVRMLVEDNGLLQAGGERTTVILGLSYQMARDKWGHSGYVKQLFHRHRHYAYDWDQGIRRVQLSPIERYLRLERDRANRFLRILILPSKRVSVTAMPDAEKRALLIRLMAGEWRSAMRREVQELVALIDYLQQRNVHVRAILHPNGSWQNGLPYNAAYRDLVMPILASRRVPLTDYSSALADDDFIDHVHARYPGQAKMHTAYHELALQALAEMGTKIEP
jgi:hypothetical protein